MRVRFPLPALVCLAAWVAAACVDVAGPPAGAVRFTPSVRFRGWWALVEACSGRVANFDAVKWYVLPNESSFQLEGQTVNGAYYPAGNQIVLADGEQVDGLLVRHEMLHALLPANTPGHPREYFLGRCGDIVVCEGQCESDAGGPLATSSTSPVVEPSTLTVGTIVAPNPVSVGADSGWLPVTVTVTNNAPEAVQVKVTGPEYAYVIGDSLGYGSVGGPVMYFAPAGQAGATRRYVFDDTPTVLRVPPGDYNVTGKFVSARSGATLLHITR